MVRFDRSSLPPAELEFVVIADTHHIVDPFMYPAEGDSVNPDLVRDWSGRGDVALAWASALGAPLAFHVGDLQQEYPGHEAFDVGRRAAVAQMRDAGLTMHHVAGNMDIGDKADPTMPAGWVEQAWLDIWHEDFGPSHFAVDKGPYHFVGLNSQVLNSDLEEGRRQHAWLEADLRANDDKRIFVFLHIPPFLVDEDEPGLGSYDVLDEPDRSWLLGLARRFRIEAIFAGHTHFQTFNAVDGTRIHTAPSTTTTRPGFYEALSVEPPLRGWADTPKLGFFLVRALPEGSAVHPIRTSGRALDDEAGDIILTRVTKELPASPVGAYLRLPLARHSDGAIAYPYEIRHRIRDDYPLLACLELGLGHVRFPIHDLDSTIQRSRLALLRDEGVALTGSLIVASDRDPPDLRDQVRNIDMLEFRLAGATVPDETARIAIASAEDAGLEIALSPIVMESGATVHKRSRSGYRASELAALNGALLERSLMIARAVCSLDPERSPWDGVRDFAGVELEAIGSIDLVVPVGGSGPIELVALAERLFAASTIPGCRVIVDPLQELDRTAAVIPGLLDRLSNPAPAFDLVRVLTTIIFGELPATGYDVGTLTWQGSEVAKGITTADRVLWLIGGGDRAAAAEALVLRHGPGAPVRLIDALEARSWTLPRVDGLSEVPAWKERPMAIIELRPAT